MVGSASGMIYLTHVPHPVDMMMMAEHEQSELDRSVKLTDPKVARRVQGGMRKQPNQHFMVSQYVEPNSAFSRVQSLSWLDPWIVVVRVLLVVMLVLFTHAPLRVRE